MIEFGGIITKTYAHLMDYESEKKKAKGTKKCVIKCKIMYENYTDSLFNDKIVLKSQQRFKSDHHNEYTEKVNKIVLSSNDDKRLQTFDKITTYPHGTNIFKVCEKEMLMVMKYKYFVFNDKNHIKKTNRIFKTIVKKCILNRSRRYCNGKMFSVMILKKQAGFLKRLMQSACEQINKFS